MSDGGVPEPQKPPSEAEANRDQKTGRFGKGNTIGRLGKPLGTQNFKQAFETISALLAGNVKLPGGETRMLTGKEKIALQVFAKALRGDLPAATMIVDRLEGKPIQPQAVSFNDVQRSLRIVLDEGDDEPDQLPTEEISHGGAPEEAGGG